MKTEKTEQNRSQFYKMAWRWHFYAGLFVTPFMIILALTGIMMMYIGYFDGRDGEKVDIFVPANAVALSIQQQEKVALRDYPNAKVLEYFKGHDKNKISVFRIKEENGKQTMVGINPYTAQKVGAWQRRSGWYNLADSIHGDLLIGDMGDRLLEISAGFGFVLLITGFYLWWPRDKSLRLALIPNLRLKGRLFYKELHVFLGLYTAVFFVVFLLSGMAWTGVWGKQFVQAWSSFPEGKWSGFPLSDKTHASLNYDGTSRVPWGLELTKLPASGSKGGSEGVLAGERVNIDAIANLATRIGFEGRYRVSYPQTDTGVWSIKQDTMSYDAQNPFSDKIVHVDRYTGNVLAKITYDDYSWGAKALALSVPFHLGLVTVWNLILNTFVCLAIIVMSISGVVMWWKRRPSEAGFRLFAPSTPEHLPHWKNAMTLMLVLSLAFPLVGLSLVSVLVIDMLLFSRLPKLKKFFI